MNMTCKNRVKPKLLRDVKTEALLVFIRTTLEQSFHQIDKVGYNFRLGNDEDNEIRSADRVWEACGNDKRMVRANNQNVEIYKK